MRYYSVYIEKTNDFYTYASDDENIKVGDRVLVSFRNKERVGLILKEELEKDYPFKVLKIKRVLYEEISFSKNFVALLLWIKEYYLSSFDQVFSTAVPSGVKIKYEDVYRVVKVDSLFALNEVFEYFLSKIKVRKKTLVDRFGKEKFSLFVEKGYLKNIDGWYCLDEDSDCSEEELKNYFELRKEVGKQTLEKKFDKKVLDKMVKNGELIFERRIKSFDDENLKKTYEMQELIEDTKLNLEQQKIKDAIEESNKKHFLIRGVTGSGKTEIYIHLIKRALEKGDGSIFWCQKYL
ncbi:DEAD/DEAH box helicase family protein [Cetobacterium sp.]|uniref:primosomal protein N' family DNA-binding protein n=1 Tax=Cetobacterium sp. TaxID=2071632 RepID=UPI003FA58657